MSELPRVVVAMSGGVDSSVAAALLVERGYPVTGVMLRLWSEPGAEAENRCCAPMDVALARRVAARLGIPFYVMDVSEPFRNIVVQSFLDGYAAGDTPNPCLVCNRQIRWGLLLERVCAVGGQFLATGHYARLQRGENDQIYLLRAKDLSKDQSYMLCMLNQEQLSRSMFPLGEINKSEVRAIARRFGLEVADKDESQDLCFLGRQDYRQFLARYVPASARPGPITDQQGRELGVHPGLAFYTIGQRKGLGIANSEPLYVLAKDLERNRLIVGKYSQLGQNQILAGDFNWISGQAPAAPFKAQVKIRYKAAPVSAVVYPLEGGQVQIEVQQLLRDITPGQTVVLYDEDIVLGGGVILKGSFVS